MFKRSYSYQIEKHSLLQLKVDKKKEYFSPI